MSRDAQAQPIADLSAFRALAPVTTFGACVDRNQYRPVAADWSIIITDVRGPTAAIEAGRLRQVNHVGAMGVGAVNTRLGGTASPLGFGWPARVSFRFPPAAGLIGPELANRTHESPVPLGLSGLAYGTDDRPQ